MEDLNQELLLLILRLGIIAFACYCLGIGLAMLIRRRPFMMRTAVATGLFGAAIIIPLLVIAGYLAFNQAWLLAAGSGLLALVTTLVLARNARGHVVYNVTLPLLRDALSAALASQGHRYIIETPGATDRDPGRRGERQLTFFQLLDHDAVIQIHLNAPFLLAAMTVINGDSLPYPGALFSAVSDELSRKTTPVASGAAFFLLAGALLLFLALGPAATA